ncbi:hypothetical protein WR25_19747 [Diploscapter pachys]|uniref:CC domain-containing protein n=1 Tax=Diploscapter pachys TaxID=2018661 RepID=A0A2A2LPJ3_9BILA|nr:hypothetical protein WR25_19747 [Diploscapter pachys]
MVSMLCLILVFSGFTSGKITSTDGKKLVRGKRMSVYYNCGTGSNSYYSTAPCYNNYNNGCYGSGCYNSNNCGNNCGYNVNSYVGNPVYYVNMPNNAFNNGNCNNQCNNFNCNGGYIYNSNPCYNSCCGNGFYNPYNNNNNNNVLSYYNPYGNNNNNALPYYNLYGTNVQTINPAVSFGSYPGNTVVNGVTMCSGGEPSGGRCELNACPHGHVCVAGNICCRCAVGASSGTCQRSDQCGAGYECGVAGYCCPANVSKDLKLEVVLYKLLYRQTE